MLEEFQHKSHTAGGLDSKEHFYFRDPSGCRKISRGVFQAARVYVKCLDTFRRLGALRKTSSRNALRTDA